MRMFLTMSVLAACSIAWGEPKPEVRKPDEELTYRKVGDVELKLEVFRPKGWKPSDSRPAVVFFFGGGWVGGSTTQFHPQATRLAKLGMVAYCADSRVRSRHKTSPFEAVADAKAAVSIPTPHVIRRDVALLDAPEHGRLLVRAPFPSGE